jgi:hypothetical protein
MNSYKSFKHFVEVHNISQETITKCFGKDYFAKNPMFDNCRVINRLSRKLELGITVRTVYPTNSTVAFQIK